MLQSMREKTQGIIAGAIVSLIAITFALWGIQNYIKGDDATREVAKVNGIKITQNELHIAYERAKRMQMLNLGSAFSLDQQMQARIKQEVLQELIKSAVINSAAQKMGMGIGAFQLNSAIAALPVFQSNGQFSMERFNDALANLGYSEKDFIDEMKHSLIITQLQMGIVTSDFILPDELDYAKQLLNQKRDFGYFIINPNTFNQQVTISAAEEQKYYHDHIADFMSPEKISVAYLQLSADDLQKQIKPSEAQVKQYYQEHLDMFSSPKKWQIAKMVIPVPQNADAATLAKIQAQLNSIATKARAGEDFSKLAGPSGTLSWMVRNEMLADFASTIEKLSVGQISEPFRTKEGMNLVKIIAITPAKSQEYAQIADKIKKTYVHQQLMQLFAEQSDKLADLTYTNSDSLTPAANALSLEVKTTPLVTKDGAKTGVLADPKIIKAAFSDTVLKQNYNSSPIELHAGEVVVLRIKDHVPAAAIPFAKVKTIVDSKLKQARTAQKAALLAKEIQGLLESGKSVHDLSVKYNLAWHGVSRSARNESGVEGSIAKAAFALIPPENAKTAVVTTALANNAYAVIQLKQVYRDAANTIRADQLQDIGKDLQVSIGEYTYSLFTHGLMHKAKVKIYESVTKDVEAQ